ncbi:MAG: hypothetical protein KGL39_33800 [Patescibacteria group bacterium]|nr:hypothetical protein [Patescibacteria group bacterium]
MRILNLGCGVQSTAVFLLAHEGRIAHIDHAIFADTQEEPDAVYRHLAWLKTVPAPVPIIHVGTAGRIGDDLARGVNTTGQRFATIPAFTAPGEPNADYKKLLIGCKRKIGKHRRQCTKEYKTQVVERIIRREIFHLAPRERFMKGVVIDQLFGISLDEKSRAERITKRFESIKWARPRFPLIDLKWTRKDCKDFLKPRVPHEVPRSACVFCPFKSASEWLLTKQDPKAWARAVEVDEALRRPGAIVQRGMNQPLYVHRSAVPLAMVDLDKEAAKERERKRMPLFELMECGEGMCGL